MANYVGIDLGTTNSAICTYDGLDTRIWKSPEQSDVTPSAIYIDKRGNRYYGQKAYNQAAYNPDNSATLFKRFIGTDTGMHFKDADITMSPEECSAEILRILYGYLPETLRNDPETGTVITVPAAFSVMKKEATMEAAQLAGIGRVALMQEPVAAIMSILKNSAADGLFLVYDLGGGTFDVSIAEAISGKISLLAHSGIEMCGGRDIDRSITDLIVIPWLKANFNLPDDLRADKKFRKLVRIAEWAAERAKIEVSYKGTGTIAMSEDELRCSDLDGEEIFLDIDITQAQMDSLMDSIAAETVKAARETIEKAGLKCEDISKVVFVGGPTNYAPLRDRVSAELGIPTNTDVNPMTAVAEGAAIYAESIDWSSEEHNRKSQKSTAEINADIQLNYISRTASENAMILLKANENAGGYAEFVSTDTGWTSGRIKVEDDASAALPLLKKGDNHFRVMITDERGNQLRDPEMITITRTMATVSAIPASHSIGIEVISKPGGKSELVFMVREGDPLPCSGTIRVKAGQTIRSGSTESINIKLWEGEIQSRIEDNRFVGVLKIRGTDIDAGMIPVGADIDCEFEVTDSGQINLEASVPYIAASFRGHNLYSRQEGAVLDKKAIAKAGRKLLSEIEGMLIRIPDTELYAAKVKAQNAANAALLRDDDAEQIQRADSDLLEARRVADRFRNENVRLVQQIQLDNEYNYYMRIVHDDADRSENAQIENLYKLGRKAIEQGGAYLEDIIRDMNLVAGQVLWRQDWYIIKRYQTRSAARDEYVDTRRFDELCARGDKYLANGDIKSLRVVLNSLYKLEKVNKDDEEFLETTVFDEANIFKE